MIEYLTLDDSLSLDDGLFSFSTPSRTLESSDDDAYDLVIGVVSGRVSLQQSSGLIRGWL